MQCPAQANILTSLHSFKSLLSNLSYAICMSLFSIWRAAGCLLGPGDTPCHMASGVCQLRPHLQIQKSPLRLPLLQDLESQRKLLRYKSPTRLILFCVRGWESILLCCQESKKHLRLCRIKMTGHLLQTDLARTRQTDSSA